ncbi:hypothetical protein [Agrilutibacter solisilvae]|uniref:Lipoprotein n=1 Tax=Agrilutibacter solisilvae TaxID=2763317 RepID=A0A974Y2U2_9GAMM|nr:hypothetical protein [Lysobacter solisilvae]QSX79580.1 hypothetical protein I8J32_006940 [Lysobacter solisilvae]
MKLRRRQAAIFLALPFILAACGKSGFAHCVQVAEESDFTGKWLKADKVLADRTVRTEECAALDAASDDASGPRTGKVRWAECSAGPDCGEAGKF